MAHLVLVGNLGVYPAGLYNSIESGTCDGALEGNHFNTADFAGQHDGPRRIGLYMDLSNGCLCFIAASCSRLFQTTPADSR